MYSKKKKKVKLCIYIWKSKAWLRALESTYLRQLNYQKCCVTMPLWQSSNLVIILCHQSFLLHCLSYLLGAPSFFGEYFFPYDFKNIYRAFDYFTQFKCCVKRASNYFCCINDITVNLTEEHDRDNLWNGLNLVYARCYSSLSTNHARMLHQALI